VAGKSGWSSNPGERSSFRDIFEDLQKDRFCVDREGFDWEEVGRYGSAL
jgi:hypothetical protein